VRITGGRFRGRALAVPPGAATRPTSDRARQAIFNILDHAGPAADLVFVDPPYGSGLGEAALARAAALGWIAADALIVFERGRGEPAPQGLIVADDRAYGAARVWFCRAPPA
jgi:16S rRNA G966 N2-methylase RsmD